MTDIPHNAWGDEIPFDLSPEVLVEEPRQDIVNERWEDTFARRRKVEAKYRAGSYSAAKALDRIDEWDLWPRQEEDCPSWQKFLGELFTAQMAFYVRTQPPTQVLSLLPYQGATEADTGRMELTGVRVFGGEL